MDKNCFNEHDHHEHEHHEHDLGHKVICEGQETPISRFQICSAIDFIKNKKNSELYIERMMSIIPLG